ncbi:MAG: type II toxin-antitoxin system RelE/ParE family toxin [Deltaproteobacteria bacterium]|nr:type II toxin-antitoxin system RelE/ParE family toxin [Deltaproteobacteria bacterium]
MRLRIFSRARRDITTAVAWWRANRPFASSRLEDELGAALRRLEELPFSGPPATDVRLSGFRRLSLLATRYFIYYRVNEARDQVEVLRVWHMSRHRPPAMR